MQLRALSKGDRGEETTGNCQVVERRGLPMRGRLLSLRTYETQLVVSNGMSPPACLLPLPILQQSPSHLHVSRQVTAVHKM